jgi:predicted alpha-1,6-mannanase (GH76 family)
MGSINKYYQNKLPQALACGRINKVRPALAKEFFYEKLK